MNTTLDYHTEARLASFFAELRARRHALEQAYADFAPNLAPNFNTFDFVQPDEMLLSEMIGALLNARHNHAQGNLFLRLFLSAIGASEFLIDDTRDAKIILESSTYLLENTGRRIDIEINLGQFGIAVENKPWAADQADQLVDYGRQMEKKYGAGKWRLVYLSGSGTPPQESSLPKAVRDEWEKTGQYVEMDYGGIVQWLTECEARCRSDHVRHYLRDFISYCNNQFLSAENNMNNDQVREFALKAGNLEVALVVAQEVENIKEQLFSRFIRELNVALIEAFPGWDVAVSEGFGFTASRQKSITVKLPHWTKYRLCIEFGANRANDLYWGVAKVHNSIPDLSLLEPIKAALPHLDPKRSAWWPTYIIFEPYSFWDKNKDVWLDIAAGAVVGKAVQGFLELKSVVEPIISAAEESVKFGT